LYRMDEHGHGRLGDGGEIIGDVLFTGVGGCLNLIAILDILLGKKKIFTG
jgi:hypothetical protein